MNIIDVTSDEDLERVTGGTTCDNAIIAAKVYGALSEVYNSLGMRQAGSYYAGKAGGVLEGGCPA